NVLLSNNAFGQTVFVAGQREFRGWIGGQVSHALAEPEQTLYRRQGSRPGNRRKTRGCQELIEALQVGKRDPAQAFAGMVEEAQQIAPVATAGVGAVLAIEPEIDEVGIAGGRHNDKDSIRSAPAR